MIDTISEAQGIAMNTIQSKALVGIGSIGEVPILLVKPQAYMNFSGETIGPLAAHYPMPVLHILLSKECNGPPGWLPWLSPVVYRYGESTRQYGHEGLSSSEVQHLERQQIDEALEQGVEAVRNLVLHGFNNSICRLNLGQKYKYHKVEL